MENLELVIYSPQEYMEEIDFNFVELKQTLLEKLEKYKGMTYTEESIQLAKTDRANLNKLKKAINDKKVDIKKQCMKPYEEFESKVKELIGLIDEPIEEIDKQIKTYEEKQRQEKQKEIETYYYEAASGYKNEAIGSIPDIIPLSQIQKPQWLNVAYAMKNIKTEINEAITKVRQEIGVIESLKSEFEVEILNKYVENLSLADAMTHKMKLEEMKRKIEEQKKREEEKERQRKEQEELEKLAEIEVERQREAEKQAEEIEDLEDLEDLIPIFEPDLEPEPQPQLERLTITLLVTPEQKNRLRQFILDQGIEWVK
ncbi:MAG TPA: DUF1351 domain-containing protein [Bacteroidales bacterium]|nr:DUF1351 domain-containing protein [Bacteroidales bacterium]